MSILILNAGSSSLRFSLFDKNLNEVCNGHIDAIGQSHCVFRSQSKLEEEVTPIKIRNHKAGLRVLLKHLIKTGTIKDLSTIKKVGHRVVHGGEHFSAPTAITNSVLKELDVLSELAPLHNPSNLIVLRACLRALPKAKHFAVFDTAFHSTLPEEAYLYGLPYSLYEKKHLRRYGFHGTSHRYVSAEACTLLKKKSAKILSCHIGNGVSITAIKNGKSIDTSMGFTPLEGPLMGTRSGSVDPGLVLHLVKKNGLKKTTHLLQNESGFKGLSGLGSDIRTLWAQPKNPGTLRTFKVFSYQMAKQISAYFVSLGGLPDALVFTAGIGENAHYLRKQIVAHLKPFGMLLDEKANKANSTIISNKKSTVKILVIPTNEALQMAREITQ